MICGLQGWHVPCSGFRLQHVTWEAVSGGLLHPGNLPLPEVRGLPSPLAVGDAGLEEMVPGTRSGGEEHTLGAQGFEQPTCGALENRTNERTDSGDELLRKPSASFSPLLAEACSPVFLLVPSFPLEHSSMYK